MEKSKLDKFGSTFNFNQQELKHGYQTSMTSYSDSLTFDLLLNNPMVRSPAPKSKNINALVEFGGIDSVAELINRCLVTELI